MEQVLLVTDASRGIGAATALLAARQGWAVAQLQRERTGRRKRRQIRDEGARRSAEGDVNDGPGTAMFERIDATLAGDGTGNKRGGRRHAGSRHDRRRPRRFDIKVIGSIVCAGSGPRRQPARRQGGQSSTSERRGPVGARASRGLRRRQGASSLYDRWPRSGRRGNRSRGPPRPDRDRHPCSGGCRLGGAARAPGADAAGDAAEVGSDRRCSAAASYPDVAARRLRRPRGFKPCHLRHRKPLASSFFLHNRGFTRTSGAARVTDSRAFV